MPSTGAKQNIKIASLLKRVLVLDSRLSAKLACDMLRDMGAADTVMVSNDRAALDMAKDYEPQIIFTEYKGEEIMGIEFIKALRRSNLGCRKSPVIMMTANITKSMLGEARDAGVDELMIKPFSQNDMQKRLDAVFLSKRPWIEGVRYIGPDRRRFNSSDFAGESKRKTDKDSTQAKLEQAIKILYYAVGKLESDTQQAIRSIMAQLEVLIPNLKKSNHSEVREALSAIITELRKGAPTKAALEPSATALMRQFNLDIKDDDGVKEDKSPPQLSMKEALEAAQFTRQR